MKTRIKVENTGGDIWYYAQIKNEFYTGFKILVYFIPLIGQIILIRDLCWLNMEKYSTASDFKCSAYFRELEQCQNYIKDYILNNGIPSLKPKKEILFINYP